MRRDELGEGANYYHPEADKLGEPYIVPEQCEHRSGEEEGDCAPETKKRALDCLILAALPSSANIGVVSS